MITSSQTIDRDTLNTAFTSKTATGTQIMAGSLHLLGNIQVDGTTTVGSLNTGAINAGAYNITTTGTISGTFSGNGASLTSLNGSNVSSGTVADARLSSNVILLNAAQTITGNKTMNAILYFANGTTYNVDNSGNAVFNGLSAGATNLASGSMIKGTGTGVSNGAWLGFYESNGSVRTGFVGDGSNGNDDITLYADRGNVVISTASGAKVTAATDNTITLSGNTSNIGSMDVQGELKSALRNEFPDALLSSRNVNTWTARANTTIAFDIQAPAVTGAAGSLKITVGSTSTDSGAYYNTHFPVNPNDWITFSAYAFATTTGVTGCLYILFYDANNNLLTAPSWTGTYATGWTRYNVTAQAPSSASYFQVRVDADTSSAIAYASAFQVERGRTMSGFKPYTGGVSTANFFSSGMKIASGGEIHSGYNDSYFIKDHANGHITMSAAGGDLYLGYINTGKVRFEKPLYTNSGGTLVVDTSGKLYYQGNDIDGRYLALTGGTMTGVITMGANNISGNNTGYYLSLNNGSTLSSLGNTTITADSDSSSTTETLTLQAGKNILKVTSNAGSTSTSGLTYNGNQVWHSANDGSGSGLDADYLKGYNGLTWNSGDNSLRVTSNYGYIDIGPKNGSYAHIYTNITGGFYFNQNNLYANGNTIWHAGNDGSGSGLDADTLDALDSTKFMRTDVNTSTSGTLTVSGALTANSTVSASGTISTNSNLAVYGLPYISSVSGSYREGGILNFASRFAGSVMNRNSDFIQNNMTGYNTYDNNNTGRVTRAIVADDTIPNKTGKLMRVTYSPVAGSNAVTPGWGGFTMGLNRTTGNPTTWGYKAGNRYIFRLIANIPSGKTLNWTANATGSGGGSKWLTGTAGTGNWQEYALLYTYGNTGTFADSGYYYLSGGTAVGALTTWAANTAYSAGANTVSTTPNGLYYTASVGTSSGTQPTWPTTDAATVQDKPSANWAANTAYASGAQVNPTTANGYYYVATTAGTSTGTQPTWPTTSGATVNDSAGTSTWAASTAYAANALVVPTTANGMYYACTTAGTSGSTQPTWPTTAGATVSDGGAVWTAYTMAVWTTYQIITWTSHLEKFTWDVAICQVIGLDEIPDIDRASTLNVGYKSGVDIGWGEIYSTGKITTDSTLNSAGLFSSGSGASTIQSGSGSGVLSVYGIGDSYGSGTVLWVKNDSTNTNNNYARFTADANGTPVHFLDILYAGSNQVTLNNTAGGGININGGAVTTSSTVTVGGANLTVNKSGNWSYISFPAQSSDRGFIGHYENNNASEMRFVVSDDGDGSDIFTFGTQTGTTTTISGIQAGTWTEAARINSAGAATFKGLTVNGTTTLSGIMSTNSQIQLNVSNGTDKGLYFSNGTQYSKIDSSAGNDLIIRSNQIRFGTSTSGWDYNVWAGMKYDNTVTTLTIGGPIAFQNNSSTTRITMAISGTDAITMDGKVTINPVNAASIGGTTMANGHLLLGTTSNGLAFDVDEITSSGSALFLETIGAYNITLKPNNTTVLDVSTTAVTITGTTTSSGLITATSGLNVPAGQSLYVGANNSSTGSFRFYYNGTDSYLDYNTNLHFRAGTADKVILTSGGSVGIGNTSPSYLLHASGDIYADGGWLRVSGAQGLYFQTYGGGWYMTDSTWIRNYASKQVYINATTRLDNLQVGTGTTSTPASDLTVSGSSFNYRNTIWSDGNHSAIRKTSGAHSLDVYSNVSWEGINLQTSDDTLSMGFNFQNSGGSYAWTMARVNSSTASYPDLVFYGGNSSTLSGLPEVLRLYHSKGLKLQGNAMIAGSSTMNQDPSITLALGDADTGFNWTSDGNFNIMANNVSVASISSSQFIMNQYLLANSNLGFGSGDGNGLRFWNSDNYKIYMSSTGNGTWGGSISTVTNTDYNIYFRIQGGGTRGFVFNNSNGNVAQIDANGEVHSNTGFRTKNYALEYNSTEDSLDFVYYG